MPPLVAPTQEAWDRTRRSVRREERRAVGLPPTPPGSATHPPQGDRRLAKTVDAISKGGTGTIEFYRGDTLGSETATGDEVEAYCRFADLEADVWVLVERRSNGWEVYAAEC